jgi:hypothetical protein
MKKLCQGILRGFESGEHSCADEFIKVPEAFAIDCQGPEKMHNFGCDAQSGKMKEALKRELARGKKKL